MIIKEYNISEDISNHLKEKFPQKHLLKNNCHFLFETNNDFVLVKASIVGYMEANSIQCFVLSINDKIQNDVGDFYHLIWSVGNVEVIPEINKNIYNGFVSLKKHIELSVEEYTPKMLSKENE